LSKYKGKTLGKVNKEKEEGSYRFTYQTMQEGEND